MAQSSTSASANPDQDVSISNFQSPMAQASTSASANSDHDVFINHRGPDTKKTFASYLYRRLRTHQLRVFLDEPELSRGDDFPPQIENAIRSASVHVAIFSPGYAYSSWCLDELVEMLDTKKPIIPVFYKVKPDDLTWSTQGRKRKRGKNTSYAESLEALEMETVYNSKTRKRQLRYDSGRIEKWRTALSDVPVKSGFVLEEYNGDEGELLEKVVFAVLNRVEKRALPRDVGKYPTGLDEKVEDFEKILLQQQHSGTSQILGIVGLGGIGKTTLATEFFNRKMSDYSTSCFFPDVKDKEKIKLQKKLLKMLNVADEQIEKVTDVSEGKAMIRKHIISYKVLLVIDDVDNEDQVDALFPHESEIHPDSLILITSRDRQVLINSYVKVESIYTLSGLSEKHSLELFCSHSFNESPPPLEFESLVKKFVKACGGLPLSLKVIGALLKGKNKSFWEGQLNKLPRGIKEKLQISYNALEEDEQEIFLDIACFLIGEDRDMVIRIVGEGFQNLEDRCLVEVDHEKKIKMHDHVRDMGRELAKGSGLPRRLWRWTKEDHADLLRESRNGQMPAVRGVRIVHGEHGEDDVFYCAPTGIDGICMSGLQLLDAEGDLMESILTKVSYPNLKWLRWTEVDCSSSLPDSLPPSIPMKNLRVLQIEGEGLETLWQEEWQAPLELRELEIEAPLSHIPKSIGQLNHLERIVIGSEFGDGGVSITELPEEFCLLKSLKVLVLEGWSEMKALPKCFGKLTELQHIELPFCTALERLPESFGNLTNLHHLQLKMCHALEWLPESFGKLTNLQHIDLSDCWDLKRLPDSFCDLIKLQHLDLNCCSKLTLQRETLGNISTLKYINITYCEKIEVLPSQVADQRSLEQLHLGGTNLKELPSAIGDLSCMEVLGVGGGPLLHTLPSSLCYLKTLKELTIDRCQELENLPDSLGELKSLKYLVIEDCKKLKCLPTYIRRLTQLTELNVMQCPLIRELPLKEETLNDFQILPGLQKLQVAMTGISEVSFAEGVCCNLRSLSIVSCNNLVKVGRLPNTLIHLSFSDCKELEELPSIETLISLSKLTACGCEKLKHIGALGQLTKLEHLNVQSCAELEELEGIQHCTSLSGVGARYCPKLHLDAETVGQLHQRSVKFEWHGLIN